MTTKVKWFNAVPNCFPEPWFVTDTETTEVRYFNGRKYTVSRRMEHFVHMNAHDKDFSIRTVAVFTRTRQWHNVLVRHSSTQFTEWNRAVFRHERANEKVTTE